MTVAVIALALAQTRMLEIVQIKVRLCFQAAFNDGLRELFKQSGFTQ